jgi:peptidoglycan-associated lipoprotein
MDKRVSGVFVLAVCFGLLSGGCPRTTNVRDGGSLRKAEETAAAERRRAALLEAERREAEARELSRIKEEEARRSLAQKEMEEEKERTARLEEERAVREKELQWKEEEALKALARKEMEEEKERTARLEEERATRERELKWKEEEALKEKRKEFENTLLARKYPGIEGDFFESTRLQDIYFDYDQVDIRPQDVEILKQTALLLMQHPDVRIQVEGHCDERGNEEYNLALGERRANTVKQFLIALGIAHDRISTISYGEEKPVDRDRTEAAYRKNRRVHFVILSR